jgi:hypothetical protein
MYLLHPGRHERSVIAKAILEFHNQTCIRFVPRTNQDDYLNIQSGNGYNTNNLSNSIRSLEKFRTRATE